MSASNTPETSDTGSQPEQQQKQILGADGIVSVFARTIAGVEAHYTITPANLRGALYTLIAKIDKET